MSGHNDDIWRDIVKGIINVPAGDRLAIVSRLILSAQEDAARVATQMLSKATSMVRINAPLNDWIPTMVDAKSENPLVTVVPLDLAVRSNQDMNVVRLAFDAGLYIRCVLVDMRVETAIVQQVKEMWDQYKMNAPTI